MSRRSFGARRWRRRAGQGVSRAVVAATAGAALGWLLDRRAGKARRQALLAAVDGPSRARTVARATASVVVAQALLGKSLLRVPVAIAGATLAGAPRRAGAGDRAAATGDPKRVHALEQRKAARAEHRAREERRDREAHVGGWHPEPEVIEVKSPAELEPGVAHASPEPTFENRVDRGAHASGGAAPRRRRRRRSSGAPAEAPRAAARDAGDVGPAGSEDVTPEQGYLAPEVGAGVREGDLGAVAGPDEERGGEQDDAAARREPDDTGP